MNVREYIRRIYGQRMRFFDDDGVAVSIDGGINPDAEQMLMILRQRSGAHDGTVGVSLAFVDGDDGDNACGAGFDGDVAREVEPVGEDVVVVCEGDYELDDEF